MAGAAGDCRAAHGGGAGARKAHHSGMDSDDCGSLRVLHSADEGTEWKKPRDSHSRLDRTSGSFCLYLVDLVAAGKGSACRLWEKRRGDRRSACIAGRPDRCADGGRAGGGFHRHPLCPASGGRATLERAEACPTLGGCAESRPFCPHVYANAEPADLFITCTDYRLSRL